LKHARIDKHGIRHSIPGNEIKAGGGDNFALFEKPFCLPVASLLVEGISNGGGNLLPTNDDPKALKGEVGSDETTRRESSPESLLSQLIRNGVELLEES
jgi:hypothetical protein